MIKIFLSFVLTLVLTGCGLQKLSSTQTVYVPLPTRCEPSVKVTEVEEHFNNAKKDMSLYEKTQLLAAENKVLRGQNRELKAALLECTK